MTGSETSICHVAATLSFFPTHRSIAELNHFSAFARTFLLYLILCLLVSGYFEKKQLLCRIIDVREDSKESGVEDCLEVGGPSVRDAKYKSRVHALLAR